MTEGLSIIVLGLTILAFWLKNILLHMVCVIAWLFMTFYLFNLAWPAGNTYLPTAVGFFGISMVLVHAVTIIQVLITRRDERRYLPPTSSEIQAEHRRKVMGLTKKDKSKSWFEE